MSKYRPGLSSPSISMAIAKCGGEAGNYERHFPRKAGGPVIPSQLLEEVPCDAIQLVGRYRRDMGDLEALATSIATEGLLQPIGVTEDRLLVFGQRRLWAVRDLLRRPTITARIVNLSSLLACEYAENEIRKNFTPSERVEIGKALEARLGERRGKDNSQNFAELKGQRSDDL